MITSTLASSPAAVGMEITEECLSVSLDDGRVMSVPMSWYPRLSNATPRHHSVWQFIGKGHGMHWPELDEDISVENILVGQPSGEGARSFARWKEWYQRKPTERSVQRTGGKHRTPFIQSGNIHRGALCLVIKSALACGAGECDYPASAS